MADLPQIWARPDVPFQNLPAVRGIAPGFVTLAQVAEGMAERQAVIDITRASAEYDMKVEDLKASYLGKDPNTWRESFIKDEAELRKQFGEGRGGALLNRHADSRYAANVKAVTESQIKASHLKQLADIEVQGNVLSKAAGETEDPSVRKTFADNYNALVTSASMPSLIGGRPAPPSLSPEKAEEKKAKFQSDVLRSRAKFLQASAPYKLRDEYNKGVYSTLPLDEQATVLEGVRIGINNLESTVDKNTAKIHDVILKEYNALANFGMVQDGLLETIMKGDHPYLTPQEGRSLKNINDNPPTGEGAAQVRAIMSEYYLSGGRTQPSIDKARNNLRRLQATMTRPNPLIAKAANELQSDQTAVENLDAARINRQIQAARDEYDAATEPVSPFLRNILPNKRTQDLGKIDSTIRKGGDPTPLIQRKTNENKEKAKATPQKMKDVLEYGPQR